MVLITVLWAPKIKVSAMGLLFMAILTAIHTHEEMMFRIGIGTRNNPWFRVQNLWHVWQSIIVIISIVENIYRFNVPPSLNHPRTSISINI